MPLIYCEGTLLVSNLQASTLLMLAIVIPIRAKNQLNLIDLPINIRLYILYMCEAKKDE